MYLSTIVLLRVWVAKIISNVRNITCNLPLSYYILAQLIEIIQK